MSSASPPPGNKGGFSSAASPDPPLEETQFEVDASQQAGLESVVGSPRDNVEAVDPPWPGGSMSAEAPSSGPEASAPEPPVPEPPPPEPPPETDTPSFFRTFSTYLTQRENLPRLGPIVGLAIVLPLVLSITVRNYLGGAHRAFDDSLVAADGGVDRVTALAWSPAADGPLFVGTQSGAPFRIDRNGTVTAGNAAALVPSPPVGEIVAILAPAEAPAEPYMIVRDRNGPADQWQLDSIRTAAGLVAATRDNGGTVYAAIPANPPQIQQQQIPNAAASPQSSGYGLGQWRYAPGAGAPIEVGQVFGIEDLRALTALPRLSTVIAGDGTGSLFAIDAGQQISGVNPDSYMRRLGAHGAAIIAVAAATAGLNVASAAADNSVKVWPLSRASLPPESAAVQPVDIATDGRSWALAATIDDRSWQDIAAINDEGTRLAMTRSGGLSVLEIRDAPAGEGPRASQNVAISVDLRAPAAFTPDGRSLVAFNAQANSLDLLATPFTALTRRFTDFPLPIRQVAIDPTGRWLGVLSMDGTFALAELATGNRLKGPDLAAGSAETFFFSPDGSMVAFVTGARTILAYRVADGSLAATIATREGRSVQPYARFSPSGKELIVQDGELWRYSLRSGRRVSLLRAAAGGEVSGSLSADGRRLLDLPTANDVAVVDVATGTELARLPIPIGYVFRENASASLIAVLRPFGVLDLYREAADPARSGPMPRLAEDGLQLSADGSVLLVRDTDGGLWMASLNDLGSGPPRLRPVLPDLRVIEAELLPDGKSAVVAEADGTIALHDLPDGGSARILGHGDLVEAMAVSPDGAYLASASLDGRLRLTDLARTRQIAGMPFAYLRDGPERPRTRPAWLRPVAAADNSATLIRAIQQALNAAGYGGALPVDGILGPQTRAAIEDWQQRNGEKPTGEPTEDLLKAITASRRPTQSKA